MVRHRSSTVRNRSRRPARDRNKWMYRDSRNTVRQELKDGLR